MNEFGNRLKLARVVKGYTQKEVSEMIGISESTYSDWEIGKSIPRWVASAKLAEIFGLECYLLILGLNPEKIILSVKMEEEELSEFCKRLPRAEFEDNERSKTVAIKAMRVVLLALGYDTDFVENEFRKEVEEAIVVKRNI